MANSLAVITASQLGDPCHRSLNSRTELPNECYQRLSELLARIDDWEERMIVAKPRGDSLRTYEKLAKLIEEARALGY